LLLAGVLLAGCGSEEDPAGVIVVNLIGAGLELDEARVVFINEKDLRHSTTVAWPAARDRLQVRIRAGGSHYGPPPSGTWGNSPSSYEDYRATAGIGPRADAGTAAIAPRSPEVQAVGLKGGMEIALSEKKTVTVTPGASSGPVTLTLAPPPAP
jgi:hypothetical protein